MFEIVFIKHKPNNIRDMRTLYTMLDTDDNPMYAWDKDFDQRVSTEILSLLSFVADEIRTDAYWYDA